MATHHLDNHHQSSWQLIDNLVQCVWKKVLTSLRQTLDGRVVNIYANSEKKIFKCTDHASTVIFIDKS